MASEDRGRAFLRNSGVSNAVVETLISQRGGVLAFEHDGFSLKRFEPAVGTTITRWAYCPGGARKDVNVGPPGEYPPIMCGVRTDAVWLVDDPVEAMRIWTVFDEQDWRRPVIVVTEHADFDRFTRAGAMASVLSSADYVFVTADAKADRTKKRLNSEALKKRTKDNAVRLMFSGSEPTISQMLRAAALRAKQNRMPHGHTITA